MASTNGSPANAPQPPSDFDFKSTFTEVSILVKYAAQFADGFGLKIQHQPKSYLTSKEWPFSTPLPEAKVPLRGWILCSPKSTGRDLGSICNWKLVYKFHLANHVYTWLSDCCIMKHDHDIAPLPLTLDGCTEVKYEMELTPPEF